MQNLKKLKGDASHRKFFRKKSNYGNSIVIKAKKDKLIQNFENYSSQLRVFLSFNILLNMYKSQNL